MLDSGKISPFFKTGLPSEDRNLDLFFDQNRILLDSEGNRAKLNQKIVRVSRENILAFLQRENHSEEELQAKNYSSALRNEDQCFNSGKQEKEGNSETTSLGESEQETVEIEVKNKEDEAQNQELLKNQLTPERQLVEAEIKAKELLKSLEELRIARLNFKAIMEKALKEHDIDLVSKESDKESLTPKNIPQMNKRASELLFSENKENSFEGQVPQSFIKEGKILDPERALKGLNGKRTFNSIVNGFTKDNISIQQTDQDQWDFGDQDLSIIKRLKNIS